MYWYMMVMNKCTLFDGRSRRKEFWIFVLLNILIIPVLFFVAFTAFGTTEHPPLTEVALFIPFALFILAIIIPGLAVTVRRLHDTGKSGWMILLCLIPIIGGIILLVFTMIDSDPGPNHYGPNPK
jgi:uncharacterized membrane protein YhaH (DUF805 family)